MIYTSKESLKNTYVVVCILKLTTTQVFWRVFGFAHPAKQVKDDTNDLTNDSTWLTAAPDGFVSGRLKRAKRVMTRSPRQRQPK